MARPITVALHAPMPCRKRAATSASIDGASIAAIDATTKIASPARRIGRRPKRSESGP